MSYRNPQNRHEFYVTVRFQLFCFTILFYAFFGYPTPDNPGLIELIIAFGLLFSLGLPQNAFSVLTNTHAEPLWMKTGRLLLLYGITAPLITALLQGNIISDVMRDLFPFLFVLLPLFSYNLFQKLTVYQQKQLFYLVLGAGLIFAIRGLYVLKNGTENLGNIDALYLVNAPTVLFSALFLSASAIYYVSLQKPFFPLFCALLTLLPLSAMGLVLQRASFGVIALNGLVFSSIVIQKSLLRFFYLICGSILFIIILKDPFFTLLSDLFEKNSAVGSNMRLFELIAVWERINESSLSVLFGQGWGGTVQSPAVGDLTVNFTHSLISASLLKTGLIGTFLMMSFLGTLFLRFPALYKSSPIIALSLFWPFVIDIFLYASYKSLDFGFILMLIACYGAIATKQNSASKDSQDINDKQGISTVQRGDRSPAT